MIRQTVRIRFSKQGDLRLIGHRGLARTMERLFRRAALALAMSEGYHPHPRIRFPSALPLGMEGENEVVEVDLAEALDAESVRERLAAQAPEGLVIREVELIAPGQPKAKVAMADYSIPIPAEREQNVCQAIRAVLARKTVLVPRRGHEDLMDVRPAIEHLALDGGCLKMSLSADQAGATRPRDVLLALGLEDLEAKGLWLTRRDVHLHHAARS